MKLLIIALAILLRSFPAAGQPVVFKKNGGWCWFQDERVIVSGGNLIIGSVAAAARDGSDKGDVEVTSYNLATGATTTVKLAEKFQSDDHDVPAFLELPDGRILASYMTHGGGGTSADTQAMYWRITRRPRDASHWEEPRKAGVGGPISYTNLFQLPAEAGRIYNFHRSRRGQPPGNNPNYMVSDDNGASFRYGGRLLVWPVPDKSDPKYTGVDGGRPYLKYASNLTDTIHFLATEDHPRAYDNSIYHAYIRGGSVFHSDGRRIAALGDPIQPTQLTRVFDGGKENVAWTTDMHLDAQQRPYILFSVQRDPSGQDHRYYFGRWNGSAWRVQEIAFAGTRLYAGEDDYTGLAALDPHDPDTVFISTNAHPLTGKPLISSRDGRRHHEIFRGLTSDQGRTWTWTSITENSTADNLRPIVPRWDSTKRALLWLRGVYRSYTDYDLDVVGLIEDRPATLSSGRNVYDTRCAACHGAAGEGGERAAAIVEKVRLLSDAQFSQLVREGLPQRGMPAMALPEADLRQLSAYVRSLRPRPAEAGLRSIRLADGTTLEGRVRGESDWDMQVETPDRRLHLLRRDNTGWRRIKASADWPTYHGHPSGNRHSPLKQINKDNIAGLSVQWIFPIPGAQRLQVTPVVIDGVMYVTAANEAYALDSGTGRRIWQYRRPRTQGLAGDAAGGINRGVAVSGDRLFMVTDHAHLLALNRFNGELIWDVEMADYRQNYGATAAPLVVGDLVISGISGGDEGVRGFFDAYKISTGERAWRFWTIPARGEPGSETWSGAAIDHGCAATWMTGTYDPALDLLYWTAGNPCPDYNGDQRKGDNLYSDSVLAIEPRTGKLRWYFQFTPHDLHDWDAQQTPMLVDADFAGRPRKLLVQANRNGFFYVLDRANGEFLLGKPFVEKLTWASGLDAKGRPIVKSESIPTPEGVTACPAVEGATNWMSTAFHPGTGLFYVMALEKCNIYRKAPAQWEAGKSFYGGTTRNTGEPGKKSLRAIDISTGKMVWEHAQTGPGSTWGGVLSTDGGLVFYGDDSGAFAAVDASSGKPLWHFPANVQWKASPMTYMVDGKQMVAIAAGGNVVAFGLPDVD